MHRHPIESNEALRVEASRMEAAFERFLRYTREEIQETQSLPSNVFFLLCFERGFEVVERPTWCGTARATYVEGVALATHFC